MIVASFYTEGTPYETVFHEYLLPSCNKLNIPVVAVPIENKHGWLRNVAEKPRIIRELLDKYDKLVFLDADATIEQYPILFDEIPDQYDIAYHVLNWNKFYGYAQTKPTFELLSGTMFFRNRPKVKALCDAWYKEAIKSTLWEQKVLQNLIPKSGVKHYELPIEYCAIVSASNFSNRGLKIERPVILHHQKSRELKRTIT